MENDVSELRLSMFALRADLAATRTALAAVTSTLSPQQMQQALETLAQLSAAQDETAEATQQPEVFQQAMHQAQQRQYGSLQEVVQARLRRLSGR